MVLQAGQQGISLARGGSSSGSSTVPAAVVIVVKHRACLLVGR